MRVKELKTRLEKFQTDLKSHKDLWGKSLHDSIPSYPITNKKKIEEQTLALTRQAGTLKPYLERFMPGTMMQHPATGVSWDLIDAATGGNAVAPVKGPSLIQLIHSIENIFGRLESINEEDDIPEECAKPIRPGVGVDYIISAYLNHLHPFIYSSCYQLYVDGHYAKSVEDASKGVLQYLRDKTGLTTDGAVLIEATFSAKNPILAFSDLKDATKLDEQIGFMEMLKGFSKGVRNVFAHTHGKEETEQRAFEYLVMASLFCHRIDDACSKTTQK
ncbi:MAG: TIGR02391 family protein [Omnitrophica bacterium RIFCSPLOWO2_12_FULL_44_17]|uniref:TIGR02391 family protein n=1 Tax=Candidatus Danuiimicrobium aquiferis TaxID=1801832 RepID=A0A1G1KYR4_9BACT|nr:MAG: TIGR02391 family protein [Omnitrophica bacterium RIFCSPHIGHO2_02_FULL_45_28]OGW89762.1 MAG: TIGR02391 family protein [Omnitrophica bacterium RIFCSPHIGHO2_12_FULL_44_12]OGW97779.1 MAG: TIGR02391 family protein [Omnitrophica bacterium RIFCSPLOWO2_12_FULL_44_17]OGX04968.1 MAG: TIGR02391 family protein [Omnitrophica bacterium RIFCSPLOWO2_02_FULL_44_11]